MPTWMVVAATFIAVFVIAAVLGRNAARRARQQWNEQYRVVLQEVQQKRHEIENALQRLQDETSFQYLRQLHWESHNLAQAVHTAFEHARDSHNSVQTAYRRSAATRERVRKERNAADSHAERQQLNVELRQFVDFTRGLGGDREWLRNQRDALLQEVRNLNARTRSLKLAIRDNCGKGGQVWYERLEARTADRRQLPPG
ncbi:hypothetical protein [Kribbella sp. NPDC004536]|uniref:hypothetical protein n=1 Tax=Kribbella sp. NPDC004536 TaxID=3364106 RepID=UPI0036BAEBF8